MNEELLAASALLVQSGSFGQCLYQGFFACSTLAHTCNFPILSQRKTAVYKQIANLFTKAMAAPQKKLVVSIQPLKKPTDYKNQSLPAPAVSFTKLRLYNISPLMLAFIGRNKFISMESLWRHFKIS
jgi:hypothetical protein